MRSLPVWIALIWCSFTIHGTRMPWQAIVASDEDSGGAIRRAVFGMCAAVAVAFGRATPFRRSMRANLAWLLLTGFVALSVVWSAVPATTAKRAALFVCGLAVLLGQDHDGGSRRGLIVGVPILCGVMAWVSLAQWVALPANTWSTPLRPGLAGVTGHPNTLGQVLAVGFVLSFGGRDAAPRMLWLLLQGGLGVALILTNSVTSILMAVFGWSFWFALRATPYTRGLLLMAGIGALMVYGVDPDGWQDAFFTFWERDEGLSGRGVLWRIVGNEIEQAPLLGHGFGGFWLEGRGRELVGTWNPRQSHNAYLDLVVDVGVIGALLLAFVTIPRMVAAWVWRPIRPTQQACADEHAARLALIAALLAVSAFGESFLLRMDKLQFFVFSWTLMQVDPRRLAFCEERSISASQVDPKSDAIGMTRCGMRSARE